jgi:hypothetical protein
MARELSSTRQAIDMAAIAWNMRFAINQSLGGSSFCLSRMNADIELPSMADVDELRRKIDRAQSLAAARRVPEAKALLDDLKARYPDRHEPFEALYLVSACVQLDLEIRA